MSATVNAEIRIDAGDRRTIIKFDDKYLQDSISARFFARKLAKQIRQAAKS